jgi:hypothetical protein
MLPEFPNLTKCKKCNTIFWLSKLKEIGTFEWGENNNPQLHNAVGAEFLDIDDYFKTIDSGLATKKGEEIFIRQHIWWAFNDRVRNGDDIFVNENDEKRWEENCKTLIEMLDLQDIDQSITAAELYRNLGCFYKFISIICSIEADDIKWLQDKFKSECDIKNKWVIQLN